MKGYPGVEQLLPRGGSEGPVRYRAVPRDARMKSGKGPSKVFNNPREAYNYKVTYEKGIDEIDGDLAPNRNQRSIPFDEYAKQYVEMCTGEKKTQNAVRSHATILTKRFGAKRMSEFTHRDIQMLMRDMQNEGLAPGTRRHRLSFLNCLFREALRDCIVTRNPCESIDAPPRVTIKERRPVTEAEAQKLIEAFPSNWEILILLGFDCGMRIGEICGLSWRRIDFEKRTIHIKDIMEQDYTVRSYTKGKNERIVPMTDRVILALKKLQIKRGRPAGKELVFQSWRGTYMNSYGTVNAWTYHMKKLGWENPPTCHDLRHGAAEKLVHAGIGIRELQAFLGHASIATTQIYMPKGDLGAIAAYQKRAVGE
jgi:integrase